jgi:methionine aminopeptidase
MMAAAKSLTPGAQNTPLTKVVEQVTHQHGIVPVDCIHIRQLLPYVMDGVKTNTSNTSDPERTLVTKDMIGKSGRPNSTPFKAEHIIKSNKIAVDIALSTGNGHAEPGNLKTTIYKQTRPLPSMKPTDPPEIESVPRTPSSQHVLSIVNAHFESLPFTLQDLVNGHRNVKPSGIFSCETLNLVKSYPPMHNHSGTVARFKCTVLVLPTGTVLLTRLELPIYFGRDPNGEKDVNEEKDGC